MSIFLIIFCSIIFIVFSKRIYSHLLNPISIYTFIWMMMLILFEMKLIVYYPLSFYTWTVVIGAYLSFFLGCLVIYIWQYRFNMISDEFSRNSTIDVIFADDGKLIRNLIIVFSIIGLVGALQHWYVLIKIFGSVVKVLINAVKVYNMRQANEIKGVVPYLWLFSFFATFLAGVYSAYRGKISFIVILPIFGVILKDMAKVARNGILLGLFEFFFSYFFFSFFLKHNRGSTVKRKGKIIGIVVVIALMVTAVSIVKLFRQSTEEYGKTDTKLAQFQGDLFISPQIYFYASSQVGVLNKFLQEDREHLPFGASTFSSVYNLLSLTGLIDKNDIRPKAYYIPEWSNTATYLRDIYNDFGISGILIVPFLLGVFVTYFWYKFMLSGKIKYLLLLTQLSMVIGMSFFVFALSMTQVTYGIFFLYPLLVFLERYFQRRNLRFTPVPQKLSGKINE